MPITNISFSSYIDNPSLELQNNTFSYDIKKSIESFYKRYNSIQFENSYTDLLNQFTNSISYTNKLNSEKRSTSYDEKTYIEKIDAQFEDKKSFYRDEILSTIKKDDYDEGKISLIEKYMEKDFSKAELDLIKNIIQTITLENLSNIKIINGILRLITTRTYDEMYPEGQYICLSLLQNKNISLREKGIQTFEYWKSKKGIPILESLECDRVWLQDYVNRVIDNLKKYGKD